MTSRPLGPQWRRRRVLTALRTTVAAFLLGALALVGALPSWAATVEPDQPTEDATSAVQVEVTQMRPAVPRSDSTLRLRGVLRNTGTEPVANAQVMMRVSPTPLTGRFEISEVAANSSARQGNALFSTLATVSALLGPDSEVPFAIRIPITELDLSNNGVYAVFVEGIGVIDGSEGSLGRTPVLIPWFPDAETVTPAQMVALWPITAAVPQAAGNVMSSNSLALSMAPGGNLFRRVDTGNRAPVPLSWVIDPAVLQAAQTMVDGYTVGGVDPDLAEQGSQVARAWVSLLRQAQARPQQSTYLLPFGQVDAEALARANQASLTGSAVRRSSVAMSARGAEVDGLLADPPNGATTLAAVSDYLSNNLATMVVSDTFLPPADDVTYTPTGLTHLDVDGERMTLIISDSALAAALPTATAGTSALVMARQLVLAETAMISLENPSLPRTVVLRPERNFGYDVTWTTALLGHLRRATWIDVVPLSTLLADATTPTARQPWQDGGRPAELDPTYLEQIPELQTRASALESVLVNPGPVAADYEAAFLRAVSAQWRRQPARGQVLIDTVDGQLKASEDAVQMVSAGRITLSGDTGALPLTIANDLDRAVRVGIRLTATPSVRLTYTEPEPQIVEAGRRVSIEVPVQVFGSGTLPVQVTLTNVEGETFGNPQLIELTSTATSAIAAAVAIVGGAMLVLLVVARLVRGRGSHE